MVDFLYNVIARPIANEPDKKDIYHVDRAHRDAGVKRIEEDDPHENGQSQQHASSEEEAQEEHKSQLEKDLHPDQEGKGKYVGKDGKEHLDYYA
jgi:hypothetical protein